MTFATALARFEVTFAAFVNLLGAPGTENIRLAPHVAVSRAFMKI